MPEKYLHLADDVEKQCQIAALKKLKRRVCVATGL